VLLEGSYIIYHIWGSLGDCTVSLRVPWQKRIVALCNINTTYHLALQSFQQEYLFGIGAAVVPISRQLGWATPRNMGRDNTVPNLSPEIIDEIIDYLQHSPDDLRCCSQVSRFWLPRSRFHLFRKVSLIHPSASENIFAMVQRSPHIAQLIRELTIYESGIWNRTTSALSFLGTLTRLTAITLQGIYSTRSILLPSFLEAFCIVFASNPIVRLTLEDSRVPTKSLRQILQSRDRLECLVIQETYPQPVDGNEAEDEDAYQDILPHTIQINDLKLYNRWGDELLNPIVELDLECLRTLHCNGSRHFQSTLDKAGGSLLHLTLKADCLSEGLLASF
jgi:hypothetical protein